MGHEHKVFKKAKRKRSLSSCEQGSNRPSGTISSSVDVDNLSSVNNADGGVGIKLNRAARRRLSREKIAVPPAHEVSDCPTGTGTLLDLSIPHKLS